MDLGMFIAGFSLRSDGNMASAHSTVDEVERNRLRFLKRLRLDPQSLRLLEPAHSPNVTVLSSGAQAQQELHKAKPVIDTDFPRDYDGYDAIISLDRSLALAVTTADCVPVLFCDHRSQLFGIAHVGLLGVLNRMLSHVISILERRSVAIEQTSFVLGPAIRGTHYDLNRSGLWKAILPQVQDRASWIFDLVHESNETLLFDMHNAIVKELVRQGVREDLIHGCPGSTAAPDSPFFSHFAWKHFGRPRGNFMSVIYANAEYIPEG